MSAIKDLLEKVGGMAAGAWYVQVFSDGKIFFRADTRLKSGWQGRIIRWYAGTRTPKKSVQHSVNSSNFNLWTALPTEQVPPEVLAKA